MVRFWKSVSGTVKLTLIFLFGALELLVRRPATRQQRADWLHQFASRAVRAMGIATRVEGNFPESGVIVSNHMGYLDIMTFAAAHRCVFISKAEMATIPLLGWMTTMAGTVYVEPGRGGSALRARSGIHAAADAGLPIIIFAEGTTSNGNTVLPFRSGALAQAMEAGQSVTAAYIKYRFTQDNGPGVSLQNDVCFWGDDVQLFPHIFRLVALRGIEVDVKLADHPIAFTADHLHRKQAAAEARAAVMQLGGICDPIEAA